MRCLAWLMVWGAWWAGNSAIAARPNILVIVGDDMGYANIGVHGCRDIPTPHIDSLAARGVRCTNGYVSGPYCSLTRAGLLTTWNGLMNGVGTDLYRYDAESGECLPGSDGILEVNLYPQGTGSPGNRGTVDIGGSNNSTSDIARQIVEGINSDDMQALADQGRSLELDDNGQLPLNGDTGISAGVNDELAATIGTPRTIPIFQSVTGPGNNAQYSICMFAGVRIMYIKLTGSMSSKKVLIQPCNIVSKGGIPAPGATTSKFIYSPVWLVRERGCRSRGLASTCAARRARLVAATDDLPRRYSRLALVFTGRLFRQNFRPIRGEQQAEVVPAEAGQVRMFAGQPGELPVKRFVAGEERFEGGSLRFRALGFDASQAISREFQSTGEIDADLSQSLSQALGKLPQ